MAARKRTSRTPKRSTKRKSGSGSFVPVLALGAILGLGAFSLWATAHHKSPQAAISSLFQRPTTAKPTVSAPANPKSKEVAVSRAPSKDHGAAMGPVPRPSAPVAPAASKPVQQAAVQATKPPRPSGQTKVSAPTGMPRALPPRGVNTPAHSPSVIYAKSRLTIHKNAWNKSPAIGTVEKGREMRSYGKTGRWHRVIVPKTNMIGWVHEDQLIGGRNKPDNAALITGSVTKKPQAAAVPEKRIRPPKAVGEKN